MIAGSTLVLLTSAPRLTFSDEDTWRDGQPNSPPSTTALRSIPAHYSPFPALFSSRCTMFDHKLHQLSLLFSAPSSRTILGGCASTFAVCRRLSAILRLGAFLSDGSVLCICLWLDDGFLVSRSQPLPGSRRRWRRWIGSVRVVAYIVRAVGIGDSVGFALDMRRRFGFRHSRHVLGRIREMTERRDEVANVV